MDDVLMVTNRSAGSAGGNRLEAALTVLRTGAEVDLVQVDDETELTRALDRRNGRVLVVAGGDGTLHCVVQALYARSELADAVLGLVPLGTGNDFARGLGLPLDPSRASRVVLAGHVRPVDLIVADDDTVVVNNVHVGVSADASRLGARWKSRIGKLGYPVGAVQAGFGRSFHLRVEVDGEVVTDGDRALLEVSIANGASVGGGLSLAPGADPLHDPLDVLISFAAGPAARIGFTWDALRSRQRARGDVWSGQAEQVRVSGDRFHTSSDGELGGPYRDRTWRRIDDAFRLAVPE